MVYYTAGAWFIPTPTGKARALPRLSETVTMTKLNLAIMPTTDFKMMPADVLYRC